METPTLIQVGQTGHQDIWPQKQTGFEVDVIVPDEVYLLSSSIIDNLLILLQYIFSLHKKLFGKTYVALVKGKVRDLLIDLDSTMDSPAPKIVQVSTGNDSGFKAKFCL